MASEVIFRYLNQKENANSKTAYTISSYVFEAGAPSSTLGTEILENFCKLILVLIYKGMVPKGGLETRETHPKILKYKNIF